MLRTVNCHGVKVRAVYCNCGKVRIVYCNCGKWGTVYCNCAIVSMLEQFTAIVESENILL